jgi:hypothetical protein
MNILEEIIEFVIGCIKCMGIAILIGLMSFGCLCIFYWIIDFLIGVF